MWQLLQSQSKYCDEVGTKLSYYDTDLAAASHLLGKVPVWDPKVRWIKRVSIIK